jgi:predicted nucleotidyltransferase
MERSTFGPDLFDFLDLRECLGGRLHAKVDPVMGSSLRPAIGKRILAAVAGVAEFTGGISYETFAAVKDG